MAYWSHRNYFRDCYLKARKNQLVNFFFGLLKKDWALLSLFDMCQLYNTTAWRYLSCFKPLRNGGTPWRSQPRGMDGDHMTSNNGILDSSLCDAGKKAGNSFSILHRFLTRWTACYRAICVIWYRWGFKWVSLNVKIAVRKFRLGLNHVQNVVVRLVTQKLKRQKLWWKQPAKT